MLNSLNVFTTILEPTSLYEQSREKTNIVDSAQSIEIPDQHKHAAQAYQDRQFSTTVDFLFRGIIFLYLYLPGADCIGPDQSALNVQADMDR